MSSTSLHDGTGNEVVASAEHNDSAGLAPRRGGRSRKPTKKSADAETTMFDADTALNSVATGNHGEKGAGLTKSKDQDEVREENAEAGDDDEEEEAEEVYCICRRKDDGSFMISCERCEEWFHTRCIGLTQKEAKKLAEYVCDSCTAKTKKAPKGNNSKVSKKYQASKKSKQEAKPRDESEAPSEPASSAQGEESDDSDNYMSEKGDHSEDEAIDVDNDEYQASGSRPRPSHAGSESTSRATKRKGIDESPLQSPRKMRTLSSSENMKRRTSSNIEASGSTGRRPSSSHNKKAIRKPSGTSDANTEDARSKARKVLADALTKILAQQDQADVKSEEPPASAERGIAYALELESAVFETNADLLGRAKLVGTKYKDRFRTLLFSLKDAKNTTLHSRIASGDLLAVDLAVMTSDELANDVMRQATEKARLEALRNSTLKTETDGPMRKITHKGEIEIESDTLNVRDEPGKFQQTIRHRREKTTPLDEGVDVVTMRSPEGKLDPASTSLEAIETQDDDVETSISRPSASASVGPSQSPTAQLDFNSVWGVNNHATQDSAEEYENLDTEAQSYDDEDESGNGGGLVDGADDFIDSFLGGKSEDAVAEEAPDKGPKRSTTPKSKPSPAAVHRYRQVMWNGMIDLPDEMAFRGHVKQIAGRSLAQRPSIFSSFLPGKAVGLAGRLPTKSATEYLVQIGNSSKAEVVVFTLEPGENTNGVSGFNDSDLTSFGGMMKHFHDADRWGALHVPASVKGVLIKDLYLAPLYKDQEVPLWLDLAQADSLGAEWNKTRDHDMFLLIAVVVRDALRRELAENSTKRDRSVSTSTSNPAAAMNSTPQIESALSASVEANTATSSFGSDALQTLLRSLGKTTPQASSATPPHPDNAGQFPYGHSAAVPPGPPPGPPPQIPSVSYGMPTQHYYQHMPQQTWQQSQHPSAPPYAQQSHNWNASPITQQMPEEEYPGQYNPDFLAGPQHGGGHTGQFQGRGFVNHGRGRGWARGRGW